MNTGNEIEQIAGEWIVRRSTGLTAAEESEFAQWLAADPRHAAVFDGLTKTWAIFDRVEEKGALHSLITRLEIADRKRRTRRRFHVAAAAGLAAAGLVFLLRPVTTREAPPTPLAEVETREERVRKLPDGSIVELNEGARIAVQYDDVARRVKLLQGEVHFRVEKELARPFVVHVAGVDVVAVGTAFTVELAGNSVEVVVTHGKVAVDRAARETAATPAFPKEDSTFVLAGNRILLKRDEPIAQAPKIQPMTEAQINERLAWRIPRLEFDGMELSQAVALMNRSNRLQIILGDASVGRLRISGVFRADNPTGFVRIIEAAFDLKVEHRGDNEIGVSRR